MSFVSPLSAEPAFKDRKVGLVLFGILQVLLGALCALLVPFMALATLMPAPAGAQVDARSLIAAVGMYGVLAVAGIWLGIGSIRARRWAWALTLVLSWMWLIVGALTLVFLLFFMPSMQAMMAQQGKMPPEMLLATQIVMGVTAGCFYVILPGAFVLFYRSPSVRATCEARDPHVRWTDRCPLPVLAMSLMLGFMAVSVLSLIGYGGVLVFFGTFLTGPAGLAGILVTMAAFGYLAWGTYKLKMHAWWGTVLVVLLSFVSGFLTFSGKGMMEMYRAMNMPEEQIKAIQQIGMIERMDALMPWSFLFSAVVLLGYFLWVRRYFVHPGGEHGR